MMTSPQYVALLSALLACSPPTKKTRSADGPDTGATDSDTAPFVHQFSMAVIADPHVVGEGTHDERLQAAVTWVENHAAERDIQLVVILGDICWSDGFTLAHDALNRLSMPWVPIMGDNVIQAKEEQIFDATFDAQLSRLESQLSLQRQPALVFNPERERDSWLQNLSFEYGGVRFLGVDWNSREYHPLWGETPDLHDFEGGTWPWLTDELAAVEGRATDSVILLSHMPLFEGVGGLTTLEADKVVEAFYPRRQVLWANLAGHLHWSSSDTWSRAGIEVHVTDATWDDDNTLRIIEVSSNGEKFAYEHELIVIE